MLTSFNLDLWKIMKLSFLLLLCILISFQSVQSPSFDIKFHGSLSIPIVSFVERLCKNICHPKYLNHRIVYSSGHYGTINPAVITNKEVHMVHGNINNDDDASHTFTNAKKKSLKISDYFSKKKWKTSIW